MISPCQDAAQGKTTDTPTERESDGMKRIVSALIVAALLTSLAGCSSSETLTGTAKGFGGTVTVTVLSLIHI